MNAAPAPRRRRQGVIIVLLAILVGAAAAAAAVYLRQAQPTASVLLRISQEVPVLGESPGVPADPQRRVDTAVEELSSRGLLRTLGPDAPDRIQVRAVGETDVVKVTARGSDERSAVSLADRASRLLQERRGRVLRLQIRQRLRATSGALVMLRADPGLMSSGAAATAAAERGALQSIGKLSDAELGERYGGIQRLGDATLDDDPPVWMTVLTIAAGGLLGGLLAVGVLMLAHLSRSSRPVSLQR